MKRHQDSHSTDNRDANAVQVEAVAPAAPMSVIFDSDSVNVGLGCYCRVLLSRRRDKRFRQVFDAPGKVQRSTSGATMALDHVRDETPSDKPPDHEPPITA